jgi:hypothetical protein
MSKQRWLIVVPTAVAVIFVYWLIKAAGSPTIERCNEYKIYPSPDGRYVLLEQTQTGKVGLYSLHAKRVQKWFDPDYRIPIVGRGFWSHDSKRFLLLSEEQSAFVVIEVETLATKHKKVSDPSLKASLSPNGSVVFAEQEEGIFIWNVDSDIADEVKLAVEQVIDLSTITWVDSRTVLLQFGVRRPRWIVYNIEEGRFTNLPLQISGRVTLFPYANSEKQVPLLVSTADVQWVGLIDLKTRAVRQVLSLPSSPNGTAEKWVPYFWNNNPNFPVFSRYLERERKLEVIRVNLQAGRILGQTYLESPFGIDASGQIWTCQHGYLVRVNSLE